MIPGKLVPIDLPDIYTGIQASWEADIRGKLKNLDRAALTRFLAGTDGIQFVVSGIISDVIVSYYQLITKDNELRVIRESAEKEKEALDFIRAQKDAGKTNELVVQQFTAQYYNLKVLEREVMQEIVKEENRFNLLLGRYPQQVKRNSETLYYQDNIWKGKVNSGVLLNRPDIRAAEKNVAAARLDVMAARASFYPSFNINLNAGLQSFGFNYFFVAPESIMYQLAGNLLSPLINKSSLRAQYGYTKAAHADAILQYRQSLLTAFMEVSGDISELRHLENIKQLSESKLNEYQKAVESSFDLYKAARVSYLDVLISQQNALQANLELIRIYQRSRVTQVKLFRNLGGRWG
jgi:outer membrane protein TolC